MDTGNNSFTLRPIQEADIPTCAHVAGLSFEADRHTQLKALNPTKPYSHEEGMKQGLQHWLGRPQGAVETTLACDATTGEVLGWVVWGFRGFNSPQAIVQRDEELQRLATDGPEPEPTQPTPDQYENEDARSSRERLEAFTSADMSAWMKRLMPLGSRCMFICSIAVDPAYQAKGVGSALMRRGTDRADDEGVYCWVHASEQGSGMFAKHGFREVGRLELDLDRWNRESITPPEGPKARWGSYTFQYMRREASGG